MGKPKNLTPFSRCVYARENVGKPKTLTRVSVSASSLKQMSRGNAPYAPILFQNIRFGSRYNLHHDTPIGVGGMAYDLSNLRVVSPKIHSAIHGPKK
ncbi:hypothetical protein [Stenotrophomonas ginsengisoli]|uniref:hypothetical protein n=1 Tax=Stenotrophomonas ginsengisoli TaxID=336566 RepID=UPI003CCDB1B6